MKKFAGIAIFSIALINLIGEPEAGGILDGNMQLIIWKVASFALAIYGAKLLGAREAIKEILKEVANSLRESWHKSI